MAVLVTAVVAVVEAPLLAAFMLVDAVLETEEVVEVVEVAEATKSLPPQTP